MSVCNLDGRGEGSGSDAGVCLHPDSVDGVGGEVGDGGQLVVVHELGLPLRQRLLRLGRVVNLQQRPW